MAQDTTKIPPAVLKFLQGLLIDKKLDTLPPTVQADFLYDLYVRYNNFLMASFLLELKDTDRDKLNDLLEAKASEADIEAFLKKSINYAKIVDETSRDFRDTFLASPSGK